MQRAACKQGPVCGHVPDDDPLTFAGENHVMLADDVAAANCRESDIALAPGPGDPVAATVRNFAERAAPAFGSGFAQHQGCSRWRIDLLVVVRLNDLDVKVVAQRRRNLARQSQKQVHTKRHVPRSHHNRVTGRGIDRGKIRVRQTGCANDVNRTGLRGKGRQCNRRGRGGEVNDGLRRGKRRKRIIRHLDTERGSAHGRSEILTNPVMPGPFQRTDKAAFVAGGNQPNQCLTHAARHAIDHDCRGVMRFHVTALLPFVLRPDYMGCMGKNRYTGGDGPSQRQLRVGEVIRRTLSDVLNRGDVHDPDLQRVSITVGEVRTSPDLKIATAYVLPLGGQDVDGVIAALNRNRSELRRLVTKGLTLKFSPELRFRVDETFDQMDETRRLLSDDHVRRDLEP